DLRSRSLRLQEEGREILGAERMTDLAQDLAADRLDGRGGLRLEVVAEGIVGGNEEPGLPTRRHHGLRGGVGYAVIVETPVQSVGVARIPGELGRPGGRHDRDPVLLRGEAGDA